MVLSDICQLRAPLGAGFAFATLAACSAEVATPSSNPALATQTAGKPATGIAASAGTGALVAAGSGSTAVTPNLPAAGTSGSLGTAQPNLGDVSAEVLPCDVSKALKANCQTCHGQAPIGGAPMSLVTYSDLHQPSATNPGMKVHELSKVRLHDQARPMPPGSGIAAADLTMLDSWLASGAPAGTPADAACDTTGAKNDVITNDYGPLTPAPDETCYDFPVHGGQTLTDTSPYSIGFGEQYVQFYYDAPWPAGSVATRYGSNLDNPAVLHHWLMYSTIELDASGTSKVSPLPTLNGVNAQLLAGWAVGGINLAMPEDVGFELPAPGSKINIQWHFYNSSDKLQTDKSTVQICVVPKAARKHTAAITYTGTEDIGGAVWFGGVGMPPRQTSNFSGTCNPSRKGMTAGEPIHIVAFWPHMHQLGTNMKATVNHPNGMKDEIFNKPFDFNHQVHYIQSYDLMPGDTLTSTCTFNNTTDRGVPFGESSNTEMCYLFLVSYPAHALENNALSLVGATNTCW